MMKKYLKKKYIINGLFLVFLFSNSIYAIFINPELNQDIKMAFVYANLLLASLVGFYNKRH